MAAARPVRRSSRPPWRWPPGSRIVLSHTGLFNERSGMRFGQVQLRLIQGRGFHQRRQLVPHGLSTPAAQVAMIARRYMHLSVRQAATSGPFPGNRPSPRANKPEGVLLRQADHHRAPGLPVDRRTAAASGLLSGGPTAGWRLSWSRPNVPGSQAPARDHRGPLPGLQRTSTPWCYYRPNSTDCRDGPGRPSTVGSVRAVPG